MAFPTEVPSEVQTALAGILKDVYGSEIRDDIIVSINWGVIEVLPEIIDFLNDLGLCVADGKLCYTNENVLDQIDVSELSSLLEKIRTDVYGPTLRADIVKALRHGLKGVGDAANFVNDLGLTVVNGKLCVVYHEPD